jgi:hypothetical protein
LYVCWEGECREVGDEQGSGVDCVGAVFSCDWELCIGIVQKQASRASPALGAFSVACLTDVGARTEPRKRPCKVQGL